MMTQAASYRRDAASVLPLRQPEAWIERFAIFDHEGDYTSKKKARGPEILCPISPSRVPKS